MEKEQIKGSVFINLVPPGMPDLSARHIAGWE